MRTSEVLFLDLNKSTIKKKKKTEAVGMLETLKRSVNVFNIPMALV